MFTLRCTQKLLKRMHLSAEDLKATTLPEPTTALGDWYANLLLVQRLHLVMLVSDHSRLCILTTARDINQLPHRFEEALIALLYNLEAPEEAITRERNAMSQRCYGPTTGTPNGRSVLGSIIDFTRMLHAYDLSERTLLEMSLTFSRVPCSPLDNTPRKTATRLLIAAMSEEPSTSILSAL